MGKKTIKILMLSISAIRNFNSFYDAFFDRIGKRLGVNIEYEAISWTHSIDTISKRLKSDNPPDLFQLGSTWIPAYADMGFLDPVPKSFPKYEPLADWFEDISIFEGEKVCLPWIADTYMFFANRSHLDQMGLKEEDFSTTEDLLKTCSQILREHSMTGSSEPSLPLALQIRPDHDTLNLFIPWLRSYGLNNIDELKLPIFARDNRPILFEFFDYIKSLMEASHLDRGIMAKPGYVMDFEFFLESKYSFSINRTWKLILDMYRQRDIDQNFSRTHAPFKIPTGPSPSAPFAGGSMLCVSSSSKNKAVAWAIAAELLSHDHYNSRSLMCGDLPGIDRGFWQEFKDDPTAKVLRSHIQSAKPYPQIPTWMPIENILSNAICDFAWNYIYEGKSFDKLYTDILVNADKRIKSVCNYYWS